MKYSFSKYGVLLFLVASILTIFIVRTALAARGNLPRFNDLFTAITLVGSLVVWIAGHRGLQRSDCLVAIVTGVVVGVTMAFATLFSPYPFFGIVGGSLGQAVVRGFSATVAMLGGLVIMRQGGPVQVRAAELRVAQGRDQSCSGIGYRSTTGRYEHLCPATDPGKIHRLAISSCGHKRCPAAWNRRRSDLPVCPFGLLWLALHKTIPQHAAWLAGLLALLVHTFMHFDDLFCKPHSWLWGWGWPWWLYGGCL